MDHSEIIETIKQTPITRIVGQYISLRKNGVNHWGICPFHSDTKPSMSVSDSKGIFKCFSCGAAGDAITFVQNFNNIDFKEAIIEIADFLGLPTEDLFQKRAQNPEVIMAYRVLSSATQLYKKIGNANLTPHFQDFLKNRNLTPETAEKFLIGLAPKNSALVAYLNTIPENDRKFAIQTAKTIGLIRDNSKNNSEYYDTFRERIMFPIWNQFDQIVGFSSRTLFDYQHAKYMNSQESLVFNKSSILYGLNFAKAHIRKLDQLILVEGHMDMITMYQNGFKNSSAIMGTALGEPSLNVIKSFTKNIILALDNDEAGFTAMRRINRDLMLQGILAKYISYHPHKDADEFLQKNNANILQERIDNASNFVDEEIKRAIPENLPSSTDEKLNILNSIFKIISPLKESLIATERIIASAQKLQLKSDTKQISDAYRKFLENEKNDLKPMNLLNETTKVQPKKVAAPLDRSNKIPKAERTVLKKIIMHPETFAQSELTELIDFANDSRLNVIRSLVENLNSELDGPEYESAVRNFLTRGDLDVEIKEIIADALYGYRQNRLDEKGVSVLLNDLKIDLQLANFKRSEQKIRLEIGNISNENQRLELMNQIYKINQERAALKVSKGKI